MPATCEYRYEVRSSATAECELIPNWTPISEENLCEMLRRETPDPRELNDLLVAMREGSTIGDGNGLVFRATPITSEE